MGNLLSVIKRFIEPSIAVNFDDKLSHGARGAIRKLRHRGKTRHTKGHIANRGKISISHTIHERPEEANN